MPKKTKLKKSNAEKLLEALENLTPEQERILSETASFTRKRLIAEGKYPAESV